MARWKGLMCGLHLDSQWSGARGLTDLGNAPFLSKSPVR